MFITSFTLMIDWDTGRHTWKEGILFPGVISVFIILYACFPLPARWLIHHGTHALGVDLTHREVRYAVLFAYIWLAGSMIVAWCAKVVEDTWIGKVLSPLLVYVVGYGPLLCAVTFTEKTGKVGMPT